MSKTCPEQESDGKLQKDQNTVRVRGPAGVERLLRAHYRHEARKDAHCKPNPVQGLRPVDVLFLGSSALFPVSPLKRLPHDCTTTDKL